MAAFPFAPRPGAVERILPPGMEPAEGMGLVTLLSYPQTDIIHPFKELVVMVPVRVDDTLGNYVPYIYVTTDEALIPGREIAGFPKKLAEVAWEREGDRFRGSATRPCPKRSPPCSARPPERRRSTTS
jgi:acetoacetate decarboxylase